MTVEKLIKKVIEQLSAENPGMFVARDLCDERSQNLRRSLTEMKWTLRAVGVAVIMQLLRAVF